MLRKDLSKVILIATICFFVTGCTDRYIKPELVPLEAELIEEEKSKEGSIDYVEEVVICSSIDELINISAEVGTIVCTEGYYTPNDGGEARYEIVEVVNQHNETRSVVLNNGLYAVMLPEHNKIVVEQFGAYGDGVHDDSKAIQKALNCDVDFIEFRNKTYKCNSSLIINRSHEIIGNETVILTESDYNDNCEWFIKINNTSDLKISGITVLTKSISSMMYKTQVGVMNASDVNISACNFVVADSIKESIHYNRETLQLNNIDLYSNWHNITIDGCELELFHDSEAGGCIWIRDIMSLGSDGLEFINNKCSKVSHDEILAIFMGKIQDVNIQNNSFFMREEIASASVQCFTIGSKSSTSTNNINFSNNSIDVMSQCGLFFLGNVTNVCFFQNDITYTKSNSNENCFLIYNLDGTESSDVLVKSNTILINSEGTKSIRGIFAAKNMEVRDNDVQCYAKIEEGVFRQVYAEDNEIDIYGDVNVLANNVILVKNNKINIYGNIPIFFQYTWLYTQSAIYGNEIVVDNSESTTSQKTLVAVNNAFLNDNLILFEDNYVKEKKLNSNNRLYFFVAQDDSAQKLVICNNEIYGFKDVYEKSSVPPSIELINNIFE